MNEYIILLEIHIGKLHSTAKLIALLLTIFYGYVEFINMHGIFLVAVLNH